MNEAKAKTSLWTFLRTVISQARTTFKEGGFRAVIRRYGWKAFAIFFTYYLVRDVTLYILIPYYLAKQVVK